MSTVGHESGNCPGVGRRDTLSNENGGPNSESHRHSTDTRHVRSSAHAYVHTRIPAAALEAVRLASPVRGFTRIVQRNTEIDGSVLRAGQRVVLLYASANMDETQFERPEVFSLHRKKTNLGWGFGAHACLGMHLSKVEMHALLRAMIPAVSQISVSKPVPLLNNTLQGFTSLQAAFRN
jgi:cytochrome P450